MKTIWMLAAKYLRRNPKRTGIMVICMSLVVMMITVITVFAFSYQHHIKQKIIQEDGRDFAKSFCGKTCGKKDEDIKRSE